MQIEVFKNKNYANVGTLIEAIILFIVGSIIFTNPNGAVKFISYVLGIGFIIIGLFKIFSNYRNKEENVPVKDLSIGTISLVIGILLIVFSSTIELVLRITMGAWILFNGINLFINSVKGIKYKASGYKVLLVLSILMIAGGSYMILENNLVFSMIGLCIMIYSVVEIFGYIYLTFKKD